MRQIYLKLWIFIALIVMLSGPAGISIAQQTVNYASASGRVTDPANAVVAGATVTARETETGLTTATTTDAEGRFRFPYLKPGPYEIEVRASGFALISKSVTLTIGAAVELAVALNITSVATEVNVSEQSDLVETARTQITGTVRQIEIKNLPVNGRSFLDAALLVPGVSPTNTASNQLFAETSAVPGQGLSVNSQRNFSNSFIVDGLSANDDAAGLSGIFYGYDAVSEFQVVCAY
jgi:Carboxypeptidase regulatory-like domain